MELFLRRVLFYKYNVLCLSINRCDVRLKRGRVLMLTKPFFMIGFIVVSVVSFGCVSVASDITPVPETGVLILAHGGTPLWNQTVKQTVDAMTCVCLKEVVFGMGAARAIQPAIDRLQDAHVKEIVIIPLFLSAHSEMYRHLEYVLGLRHTPDAEFLNRLEKRLKNPRPQDRLHEHNAYRIEDFNSQVHFSVPYVMTEPLGSHPLVTKILLERLLKLNHANDTTIFIIAHGPLSERDNEAWLHDLIQHAVRIHNIYPQLNFGVFTLRNDASDEIRTAIHKRIREVMREEKSKLRNIVILPYLLAHGEIEHEAELLAQECSCLMLHETILPHHNITGWLEEEFKKGKEKLTSGVHNHDSRRS